MISMDMKNRENVRALLQKAIKDGDTEGFYQAFDQMLTCIQNDLQQSYEAQVNGLRQDLDSRILSARGVRQLTTQERDYYQKVITAMKSTDPKQALANVDVVMPETVIESVFEDLTAQHPLLSAINFIPATGRVRILVNTNGRQEALWGDLCDEIVKELLAGFREVDSGLMKLTAFLPVCKASLDMGPQWLDRFVRETLYEALASGLEVGIVVGTGNKMPIGMNRQVGDGVTVKGGVYPEKARVAVTDLSPDTVGNLLSLLAVDPNGKPRAVQDVLFIVNPQDYYQKVMPATTVMAPDGTYRNDVMPYPMKVIPSGALDRGSAILGLGYRYFAAAVTDAGPPGGLPVEKPVKKAVLRYEERRLGLQRYYEGKQNQVEVERVLRTPRRKGVSSQDLAVTEDGQQYRIDLVQSATDVYPPSMDLTLTRITQKYDVSNSDTGEGAAHGLA